MATKTQTQDTGRDVFVPIEGFVAQIDGVDVNFIGDKTRVSGAWLDQHEKIRHLFRPIRVHYDVEQATAAPAEKRA